MKFQTERCMMCNTPKRPTNLKSEYIGLAEDGCVYFSEFWVCSKKCFEDALDDYLDNEYSFKWRINPDSTGFAPKLTRKMEKVRDAFVKQNSTLDVNSDYGQAIVAQYHQEQQELYEQWEIERCLAVNDASGKLRERIQAEDKVRADKELEESDKSHKKESEAEEKQWARDEEETRRIHERQRKEREKQEQMDEQKRLEQERIDQLKPRPIPEETRFSGCWIVAPHGRGKTTLLLSMIMEDFKKDASIIIMDSKGDLINPIRDLDFGNRLIIIDPDNPIALNPLDVPKTNVRRAVSHLEYIFSALLEAKITPKQQALFRSVLRALVLWFDNPTIETFRDIISNGVKKYRKEIERLPPDLQDFFNKEFDRDYDATRNELIWRLRLLMENDFIRTMLNAPMTKFNLKKEMDDGKIIIIHNSQGLLDKDGAEFFARFFIAQIWTAATARSLQTHKKPCYVYIDEAQNVIRRDEMIASIIDECRSQRIALILAHQRVAQIESKNVLSALSNCAIRISNSDDEADFFADVLRTEPAHLYSLKRGQFAVFVRDLVTHAFTMDVTPADFSGYRKLSPAEKEQIKKKMAFAYGYIPEAHKSSEMQDRLAEQPKQESVQTPTAKKIAPKKDPSTPAPWGKA